MILLFGVNKNVSQYINLFSLSHWTVWRTIFKIFEHSKSNYHAETGAVFLDFAFGILVGEILDFMYDWKFNNKEKKFSKDIQKLLVFSIGLNTISGECFCCYHFTQSSIIDYWRLYIYSINNQVDISLILSFYLLPYISFYK